MKRMWAAAVVGGSLFCGASGAITAAQPQELPERGAFFDLRDREPSPFWIGAMCVPVEPTLRAQFGLKPGQGLVAVEVMAESPAARAGLQRHDVIVALDGRDLEEVGQLVQAVNDAGEKELKLEILREGKRKTLTVRPAKRPEREPADDPRFNLRLPGAEAAKEHARQMREHLERIRERIPEAEIKRLEEWIEKLERGEANQPLRWHLFGPGVVMQQMQAGGGLPAGVSVTISKENEGPAKIEVRRGEEKWNVTENELSKLPEELRGPIGGMLGGGAMPAERIRIAPGAPEGARRDMQDELEQMRRQIETLQRQMKELQRPADEQPKPPAKKGKAGDKA